MSLPVVIEINRRLVGGYTQHKDDSKIRHLATSIKEYNKQLMFLGIRDRQVGYTRFSILKVLSTFIYRLWVLAVLLIGTLPGVILFAPVFIATRVISKRKCKSALASSSVKLQGRDVMATWKLLVALALTPLLNTLYTGILVYWTHRNRFQGCIPEYIPTWMVLILGFVLFPSISFAALRIGEIGMDILKSLKPLILCLHPHSATAMGKLTKRREDLSRRVIEVINTLSPEMFPDFDSVRIVPAPLKPMHAMRDDISVKIPVLSSSGADEKLLGFHSRSHLSLDEPLHDLDSIEIFSTFPSSGVSEENRHEGNSSRGRGDSNRVLDVDNGRRTDKSSFVEMKKYI